MLAYNETSRRKLTFREGSASSLDVMADRPSCRSAILPLQGRDAALVACEGVMGKGIDGWRQPNTVIVTPFLAIQNAHPTLRGNQLTVWIIAGLNEAARSCMDEERKRGER